MYISIYLSLHPRTMSIFAIQGVVERSLSSLHIQGAARRSLSWFADLFALHDFEKSSLLTP